MFRTLLCSLAVLILSVLLVPVILVMKVVSFFTPGGRLDGMCQLLASCCGPILMDLAGVDFQVEGKENLPEGPALYMGNHQGAFDAVIPILHLGPIKSVIMKKEIEKVPFAGWMLRFFGCIFLDRSSLKASMKCITDVETELCRGGSVAVFPEGTRSRGPVMGSFKSGTARSAVRAGVPIVPFAVDGSYHCFEDKKRIAPGIIRVSILPSVETAGLDCAQARELGNQIEQMVRGEVERLQGEK